jgi:hypothetical protein
MPPADTAPTVAVGRDLHVRTVYLYRRLTSWPGQNESCAAGPDILPSAQDLAVGTLTGSRSDVVLEE